MDVIHAEEVEIARRRARAVRGLSSISSSLRFSMRASSTAGTTTTTSSGSNADQATMMMLNQRSFRYVEEIERLEVRKNRLANLRVSITHEDISSALRATESAILAQLKLELHQAAAPRAPVPAPEIEGLKRVSITKQSNNSNKGGDQIDVCAICHEEWKSGDDVRSIVGCSHAYHYNCISKWIKRKPTCPMCRYEIPTNTNNSKRRRTL